MGFLKGVPPCISPDLLHALACMGHGDEIVLADAHFPAHSVGRQGAGKVLRADGITATELLDAILTLINLDTYVEKPVAVMQKAPQDANLKVEIYEKFDNIITKKHGISSYSGPEYMERFAFYERARKAAVVVQTGETAKYGNIILTNGLVIPKSQ